MAEMTHQRTEELKREIESVREKINSGADDSKLWNNKPEKTPSAKPKAVFCCLWFAFCKI